MFLVILSMGTTIFFQNKVFPDPDHATSDSRNEPMDNEPIEQAKNETTSRNVFSFITNKVKKGFKKSNVSNKKDDSR